MPGEINHSMPILIILYISGLLLYSLIPVTCVLSKTSIQVNPRSCNCGVTSYYLDKRAATIATIKDYDNMQFIIESTDNKLDARRSKMVGIGEPEYG